MPNLQNLTPFKKGQSGNPAGKPKGAISIKARIMKDLKENPEKMDELVKYYMDNETPIMRKLLWEMIDGKPAQSIDGGLGADGETLPILVKFLSKDEE